ncbi:hypothetical protein D3C72_1839850 [compost metagenome]
MMPAMCVRILARSLAKPSKIAAVVCSAMPIAVRNIARTSRKAVTRLATSNTDERPAWAGDASVMATMPL